MANGYILMFKNISPLILILILLSGCAAKNSPAPEKQYLFSWQFSENEDMRPRGGVTTGPPVTLDKTPDSDWLALQKAGMTKFERDRKAILAMEGTYRVTFDFIETVPLRTNYKVDRPYQSWATECVKVIEDSGDFISLQHILVMYYVDDSGKTQGPFVGKHWRQDWTYEDDEILAYAGNNTWRKVKPSEADRKGKWSQAVYQVDDTPRYEALGEWEFDGNYARWTSSDTWRPLPRREFSVRDDYNVLSGVNRVIITPTGWVHEQDNVKLVVDENGNTLGSYPYLSKEVGVNRYENIKDFDSSTAVVYWEHTAPFWQDVRNAWSDTINKNSPLVLRSSYDDHKLYEYLFEYADEIEKTGVYDAQDSSRFAAETINKFIVEPESKSDKAVY